MGLSGFMVALGGTFYAQYFRFVSPETLLSFDPTLQMLLGTMVGGPGTVVGPIVGGVLFNLLSEALRSIPFLTLGTKGNVVTTAIFGATLVLTILYMPGGLAHLFHRRGRLADLEEGATTPTPAADGGVLPRPAPRADLIEPAMLSAQRRRSNAARRQSRH
jgi:branched-chain amino acid transport system permease protein